LTIQASSQLGFDYRNGGHCGAGAPRFNLRVTPPSGPETFHFIGGCANDAGKSPAPQDPQWTRVRFDPTSAAEAFPPVLPGSRIRSLTLLHDEGTDTSSTDDPQGVGLAVVDNIFVDGTTIPSGNGVATNRQRGRDDDDDHKPRRRDD
jgi:hypothetical protein